MKVAELHSPVRASWMKNNGLRLDSSPYLSGGYAAKAQLENLSIKKQALQEVTKGGIKGIYHAGRMGRVYVSDPLFGTPFLGSTDILAVDLSQLPLLSNKLVKDNPQFLIEKGWTLITRSGTIGRMAYVRDDMSKMTCSEHVIRVVPNQKVIPPGYLFAFLGSRFGVPLVSSETYGAIIQHIEPAHISNLPIPRFEDSLEAEVHNLIQSASALRSNALGTLYKSGDKLLDAVGLTDLPDARKAATPLVSIVPSSDLRMRLEGAFHSPLAIEAETGIKRAKYKVLSLHNSEVSEKLFKPNIFKRNWVDSSEYGPAFVSGNNIYRMNPAPDRYVSNDSADLQSYLLKEGTVVFQAAGQLNGLFGWPVYVNSYLDGMFCSDDVFRVVPHSKLDAGFIYAYLRTNFGQRLLKRQAYGYSIPRVVAEHVGQVLIPWPDEDVRHDIGRPVVEAWEDIARAIKVEEDAISLVERAIEKQIPKA